MKTRTDVSRERASATATGIAFRSAILWSGALLASLLLLAPSAWAQSPGQPSPNDSGINSDNYNFQQTIEFGGRVTDFTGSRNVYDTFVNLHDGVRLFEYTLNLRSLNHAGLFFDNLFWTNSGYGGDPNNFSMLRISKNKWYNFNGSFRRNLNFWNYNLLANPLNPVNTFIQVPFSPHSFHTVRRLSDLNLTLLPQSRFRFRVGYSRNISEGPVLSTIHQGTDTLLFNEWKQTVNAYRFGVDYRGLPRTNISYDQIFTYYKGDNSYVDDLGLNARLVGQNFQLSNGVAVDPGLVYNATASQPCSNTPTPIFNTATTPPTLKSACNGYVDPRGATILGAPRNFPYDRFGRARTNFPTEQLSFQSNYFKNLDLAGRLVYTSSDSQVLGFQEFYLGLITRTNVRSFFNNGSPASSRVSVTSDLAATYHITPKLRITDSFQFSSWRIPGLFLFTNLSLFATASPASMTGPIATQASDCLTTACIHNSNSPADITNGTSSSFFKQDTKSNQIETEYDFNSKIGARLGYRYRHRTIAESKADSVTKTFFPGTANRGDCAFLPAPAPPNTLPPGCTANGNGSFTFQTPGPIEPEGGTTEIGEHWGLFGIWVRPVRELRMNFDVELMSADNSFTRISPRHLQNYRARIQYKPRPWVNLALSLNILENRNTVFQVNNFQHDRGVNFSANFQPWEKFGLDLSYEYNDAFSKIDICYAFTPTPPGSSACPVSAAGVAPIAGVSLYDSTTHFGSGDLFWKPVHRVTFRAGYALTSVSGATTFLNPNSPPGSLAFNYHKPYAGVDVDLVKGLTWRGNWGYYGYNEKTPPDPFTAARDFRGNMVTLSVRYAF